MLHTLLNTLLKSHRKTCLAVIAIAALVMLLNSCQSLRDVVEVMRKPEVRIASTELEALSFTGLTLRFDVEIRNPNPIGISLSGFDYELEIEGNPFVSGEVDEKVSVEARGRSVVPLPVELGFDEVANTIGALEGKEEAAYRLSSGFTFDLPVLGRVRIPASTEGSFPILQVPRLAVRSLSVNRLTLYGSSLDLELELSNPNDFKIFIEGLEYCFEVNGRRWASGMRQERVRLVEENTAVLVVPIELDFTAVGQSVYQAIVRREELEYSLDAEVDVSTSLRELKEASLPFDLEGRLRIQR
jgi:LEA14-like dessication related protein